MSNRGTKQRASREQRPKPERPEKKQLIPLPSGRTTFSFQENQISHSLGLLAVVPFSNYTVEKLLLKFSNNTKNFIKLLTLQLGDDILQTVPVEVNEDGLFELDVDKVILEKGKEYLINLRFVNKDPVSTSTGEVSGHVSLTLGVTI